jgi:hypothetical protein
MQKGTVPISGTIAGRWSATKMRLSPLGHRKLGQSPRYVANRIIYILLPYNELVHINRPDGEYPVSTYYLLPCPCSRKIPVQARQAGERITCACGATLEVPTLLGIKKLECAAVSAESIAPKATWTAGHRIIFLGALVIFASVVVGIWLFLIRPTDPYANYSPEKVKQMVEAATPIQSWRLWHAWEMGGLQRRKSGYESYLTEQKTQYQIYWILLSITAGTGLAITTAGIVMVKLKKKNRKPLAVSH